jgi:hypothetical protein
MRTLWHDDCWGHWRGAFNNQQGWEAATEGSGGGADGRTMMVIYRTGAAKQSGWDGATLSGARSVAVFRYSADKDVNEDDDRGGTPPPTPPSASTSR